MIGNKSTSAIINNTFNTQPTSAVNNPFVGLLHKTIASLKGSFMGLIAASEQQAITKGIAEGKISDQQNLNDFIDEILPHISDTTAQENILMAIENNSFNEDSLVSLCSKMDKFCTSEEAQTKLGALIDTMPFTDQQAINLVNSLVNLKINSESLKDNLLTAILENKFAKTHEMNKPLAQILSNMKITDTMQQIKLFQVINGNELGDSNEILRMLKHSENIIAALSDSLAGGLNFNEQLDSLSNPIFSNNPIIKLALIDTISKSIIKNMEIKPKVELKNFCKIFHKSILEGKDVNVTLDNAVAAFTVDQRIAGIKNSVIAGDGITTLALIKSLAKDALPAEKQQAVISNLLGDHNQDLTADILDSFLELAPKLTNSEAQLDVLDCLFKKEKNYTSDEGMMLKLNSALANLAQNNASLSLPLTVMYLSDKLGSNQPDELIELLDLNNPLIDDIVLKAGGGMNDNQLGNVRLETTQTITKITDKNAPLHLACIYTHPITGAKLYASAALNYSNGINDSDNINIVKNSTTVLQKLAVKTVLSFEETRDKTEPSILADSGIRYVNNLHYQGQNTPLSVDDFRTPTQGQIKAALMMIDHSLENGENIHLHCAGGTGRTACFLAAFLILKHNLSIPAAVAKLRDEYSDCAIELKGQAKVLATIVDENLKYDSIESEDGLDNLHFADLSTELTSQESLMTPAVPELVYTITGARRFWQ